MQIKESENGCKHNNEKVFSSTEEIRPALVRELEIQERVFFVDGGDESPDYENKIVAWMDAVDFKGKPDMDWGTVVSETGKRYNLGLDKVMDCENVLEETDPEVILSTIALTKAKIEVIKEMMTDVYPVLAWTVKDMVRILDEVERSILADGKSSDIESNLFERIQEYSERRSSRLIYKVSSLLVLASLIISACSPRNGSTQVEITPTKAIATEVTPLPTATEIVEPTATLKPTATLEPTLEPTKIMTPTEKPREFLAGALPENYIDCQKNLLRVDHLSEDLDLLLAAERKVSLYKPEEIELLAYPWGGSPLNIFSQKFSLVLGYPNSEGKRPLLKSCSFVEFDVEGGKIPMYVYGVEVVINGKVRNLHFTHDETYLKNYYIGPDDAGIFEDLWDIKKNYPLMKGEPTVNPTMLILVHGGELLQFRFDLSSPEFGGILKAYEIANTQHYQELWTRAFVDKNNPLSEEEIDELEHILIPAWVRSESIN